MASTIVGEAGTRYPLLNSQIKFDTNLGLVPLVNFSIVNIDYPLYRSGQPFHGKDYQWLHDVLGVKDIISLRAEDTTDEDKAPAHGLKVWKIPVVDAGAPSIDQGDEFTSILERLKGNPTLVHCEHGHGRTSTFCVLADLYFGKTLEEALQREHEQFNYDLHHPAQVEFLKTYYKLRYTMRYRRS